MEKIMRSAATILLSVLCVACVLPVSALAYDFGIGSRTAARTKPDSHFLHRDSLWQQVNTCRLPGGTPHMGIFYDNGTLWHVVSTVNTAYTVYHIDTMGNILAQFAGSGISYAMDVHRVDDTIFVATYYPTPERVNVHDTTGNLIRWFSLSNGGRCRGIDYDHNTGKFWIWGSPNADTVYIQICDRTGNVNKVIDIAGGYWTFSGCIDWRYYPTRTWHGDSYTDSDFYCKIDTATGSGSVLVGFPNPGNYNPAGITYLEQGGTGYVWVTAVYSPYAYKMKVHETRIAEGSAARLETSLFSISPNPTQGSVLIRCAIQDAGYRTREDRSQKREAIRTRQDITLNIYDCSGRAVKSFDLVSDILHHTSGIPWDCTADDGKKLANGVYIVVLRTGSRVQTQKLSIVH